MTDTRGDVLVGRGMVDSYENQMAEVGIKPTISTPEPVANSATTVKQPTAFPTQKVWAFLSSTGFVTALFGMLADFGIVVPANTQAFITVILVFAAMWATPNKVGG